MYKIMFVDDEPFVLRRLHQILEWNKLDIRILPDSCDGADALEKLGNSENDIPDIMIMDINMPNMNGLELASVIRQKYPHIHCVILTVNDSFQCAQEALNVGVFHYLLKPLDAEKILTLMEKIISIIASSKEQALYMTQLQDKATVSERMIRENFLNWVVSGYHSMSNEQLQKKFQFYQIPVSATDFQLLSIHASSLSTLPPDEPNTEALTKMIIKCVEDTLCDYKNCFVFTDPYSIINVLIGRNKDDPSWNMITDFIANSLREHLLFTMNLPVTVYYSRIYCGYQNIYRCYYDTKFLSKYSHYQEDAGVISYEHYRTITDTPINLDFIRSQLLKYLRAHEIENLRNYVHTLLFANYSGGKYETFHMLCLDSVLTGIMFLQESKLSVSDIFDRHFDPLMEIMSMVEFQECEAFIINFYETIHEHLQKCKVTSSKRLTEKCIELVAQNIGNLDLSVRWLSNQLYINENHLGRQFRKEHGSSLIKFINQQRLFTAKKYMQEGCTNLQQLSNLVGFHDALYFSKCFKKEFGISPSKYCEKDS